MVGYEYEYRAAEPFFASEALEEEPEGIVDIGYALVQFRVTGREFVLVLWVSAQPSAVFTTV